MRTMKRHTTSYRKYYSTTGKNYTSNYGNFNRTTRYNTPTATYSCKSPRFNNIRSEFQWRIGSYRNVYNQFTNGRKTIWSPTIVNRWMRYVNNGIMVYHFTNREFTRFFGANWSYQNPTTVRKFLTGRYGHTIKDVMRGNNNTWLIATSRTPAARPFTSYNWYK